jgi:acyl-coenzyme A synthetase/AMP-(fatty) acid ligase
LLIITDASIVENRLWAVMKKEKATTFGGVPYTYEMLKRLHFERIELPDLRYITQAGGKLSQDLADEFIGICRKKYQIHYNVRTNGSYSADVIFALGFCRIEKR